MFKRIATLLLTATLATSAGAETFAQAPATDTHAQMRRPTPQLSERTRARLRTVLAKRRGQNVAAFRAYARRGIYPHNYINNEALNVWIDGDGHMCAAATMIFRSGYKALVRQQAKDDNYIKLADVSDGPLMDWILTSGLTHDEVVAIQAPMVGGPQMPQQPIEEREDWRVVEDRRLRARYEEVLVMLRDNRTDSLDAAIDALIWRPDLVAQLLRA